MKTKTSAEKATTTSTTTTTASKTTEPFFSQMGGAGFFSSSSAGVPVVQAKLSVNKPGDSFEREADSMADKVMRMPTPEEKPLRPPNPNNPIHLPAQKKEEGGGSIQRASAPEERAQKQEPDKLQRKGGDGVPAVSASVQSAIQGSATGGQALPNDVRGYMEPRFGADFGNVRVHHDGEAASLNNQLSAQAFTYQNHVFFGRDQYQPGTGEGKQLLAHELTHTIQQGHAVQRSPQVSTTTTPPPVQRLGLRDALDYFADKAYHIPGFRMLTILLGFNPINMQSTDRSAANMLRALIEMIPGGHLITQALDNHGVINKAAVWVEQKLATLGDIGREIVDGLKRFMDSLSWRDIFDLGSVWDRAKRIFTEPIGRLIAFGASVVSEILKMVKDAILKPLAAMAQGTRGYDLLKALLGEDPISGEPVPRNADTLIGGFMKLIGQEEIWQNIKKGNAVARAWAWFQGALAGLLGLARSIPRKIIETLTSLTFQDIITVVGAFGKILGAFINIATEFMSWALNQVISLLEILFSVVAPGAMPYIAKARAAFSTILKNPVGFVGNLVRAGKLGFQMFANNILNHLKNALIRWLTGPLGEAGVYIPQSFSLIEIVKLVLSVLGLTWQNIRSKLVKIIPEPVLVGLEKTAGILVTLVKDGPAAAWEQIKAELTELKDQLISQVTEMVTTEVVKAAVTKLVSMLNPAGAVIQAILAIYNTVTFFIQKIQQIAAVVASFIDSIAAIAAGQVEGAAKKVEQTMANTLVVIIGFLAKFAGLGNIPEKLVGVVKKIRAPIDKGLDKIVAWLGTVLNKIVGGVKSVASRVLTWWKQEKSFSDAAGESHKLYLSGEASNAKVMVASTAMVVGSAIDAAAGKASTDAEKKYIVDARKLKAQVEVVILRLQGQGKDAYDPKDIDEVNNLLSQLAEVMKFLLPLISSSSGTKPSNLSVAIGDLLSYNGRHWIVASFDKINGTYDMVYLKRLVPAMKSSNRDGYLASTFEKEVKAGKIEKISDKLTRRQLYMGSTPRINSPAGKQVMNRMLSRGKFDPTNNKFLNSRDGKWYGLNQADMGHIVDASTWWNSNGRFIGPKAPEVIAFMRDADNYEFEESTQNQSRGASLPNYLPPVT